jgi:hypothetical protein
MLSSVSCAMLPVGWCTDVVCSCRPSTGLCQSLPSLPDRARCVMICCAALCFPVACAIFPAGWCTGVGRVAAGPPQGCANPFLHSLIMCSVCCSAVPHYVFDLRRLVHWCGAQLQAPHRAVRELGFQPEHAGVFISRWHHGSPAHRFGLFALHWILEVRRWAIH